MKLEYLKSDKLLNISKTVLDCHKLYQNVVFGYFHPLPSLEGLWKYFKILFSMNFRNTTDIVLQVDK